MIFGDQLSDSLSSLSDCDKAKDIIFMCEVWQEAISVKHHKKKLAFIFSSMRHFAESLEASGHQVRYVKLDDPANQKCFCGELERAIQDLAVNKIVLTEPSEYRVYQEVKNWQERFSIPVDIREDDRFICSKQAFQSWAQGRKQLRMEYFYRQLRKQHQILMDGEKPMGGEWNFDNQNRKPPPENLDIPESYQLKPDSVTQEVISLVEHTFSDHFGDLDHFHFAVTRKQALAALEKFIRERLPLFGDFQDAMMQDQPWMYHAHIGLYLNIGLLLPVECVNKAQKAFEQGHAPINAVEGFVRQILGWREYVRGLYWLRMPDFAKENYFEAGNPLPSFYWTAETKMNCLKQCVLDTKRHAYAHHIQRLMVLGNFALLAGIDPKQVNQWFMIVYVDAYEWVELPNVSGMALFADGGHLASKPYASGGNYINKMSNYCKDCVYKVTKKNGPTACPFNYLYWNFISKNKSKLSANPRMGIIYKSLARMSEEKIQAISEDSKIFLNELC